MSITKLEELPLVKPKQRGRPKLSASHKKIVRKEYMKNMKNKKIEEGTYRPRGRPKKIIVEA